MEGTKPIKAVIYARVSTEEQERLGHSLDAQTLSCAAYCTARGWEIIAQYQESGSGAKMDNRNKLKEALDMIRTGKADMLVIWRLDRLTRSILDFQRIIEDIGPKVASLTESLDMTTASGRLVANILISSAQYEREKISDNTKLGIERARKKGKQIGRKRQIPKAEIRKVRNLRERGFTYSEISAKLGITERRIRYILTKYAD